MVKSVKMELSDYPEDNWIKLSTIKPPSKRRKGFLRIGGFFLESTKEET
jgi:hypothetical protein